MRAKPYWHIVGAEFAWLFYNNVRAGQGALLSVSATTFGNPKMNGAHSPYSLTRMNDEKEAHFERVRNEADQLLPSRLKGLFVFDDESLAHRAQREWYADRTMQMYECRVFEDAAIHRADSIWLNAPRDQWADSARQYWAGAMTESPFPEVIVRGAIYFPSWNTFPATSVPGR